MAIPGGHQHGKGQSRDHIRRDIVRHLDYLVAQRAFKNRSQVIRQAVTDPVTPDHLAARTLGRLLQREGDPRRRRELLKAFSARVEELKNGLGCTISAVYVGEHAVVLPTTSAQEGGHGRPVSLAPVKSGESVVREIDRREVPVGVGYTFTADVQGEPGD